MKNKIKKICLALCSVALLGTSAVLVSNKYNVKAENDLVFSNEYVIEKEYTYGETFTVPDPAQVQIETGAVTTKAISVVLECPDGTAKSEGDYTLDKTGTYKLTYYNANGVSATHTFVVNKRYYEIGGDASATYVESLSMKESTAGISLTLKSGESFSFNKPINLYGYGEGLVDVCKIYPKFRKEYDVDPTATTVSVKIVDCYDPAKFVEFYVWCGSAGKNPYYAGAGASTQTLTGLEQNKSKPDQMTEEYNGEMYKIHRARRYQSTAAYGQWLATTHDGLLTEHDGITLQWDMDTHQMKARNGGATYLITDIDSPEIYGSNTFDFASFFTTGEVIVNVEAYNYAASSFEIEIESIFGMSGNELLDGKVVDTVAPAVFVDVDATKDNEIFLQKGEPVRLPEISSVRDYNYYGDSGLAVYRNYEKYGQSSVKVQDGVFTPQTVGNYTAVYTATDSYGNKGTYLLEMIVLDEENISYEPTSITKLVAAKSNVIPYIEAQGLNKEVTVEVSVTTPDGKRIPLDYNGVDGYTYLPSYVGEYTITYLFKDNVYEEEYSYVVSCVDENAAAFQNPFKLPAYFMKGATYTFDPVTAYTAGNGEFNENAAVVSVSVDGASYQTLSASQMQSYTVTADKTIQFKASYGNDYVESKVYSVIDVGYGKPTTEKNYLEYFQGNYTEAKLSDNGALYTFGDGDANLQFINILSSSNFKLGFTLSAAAVEDVTFILRDVSAPEANYVTYSYQKENGSNVTLFVKQYADGKLIAEGRVYTKHKEWNGTYSIAYSSEGLNVDDTVINVTKPFEKDGALFEVCLKNVKNGSIALTQLNNQSFSLSIRESKPQITFAQRNGVQEANSVYSLSPCYASSVMCWVLSKDVTLTVTAPNGEVAKSVDGIRLENVTADRIYDVKLTQVGQYHVSYAVSCIGSTRTDGQATLTNGDYYIINVSESIAPTIKFKDGYNTQTVVNVKAGSTHKIKDFTVSDNVTESKNLKVYTMILDDRFILEENGYNVTSYTFNNYGNFVVYVLVYDEQGNSSANYYNVVVS